MTDTAATPSDWNVVITGAWNPAILTPSGIARRLFALDAETPVEVLVTLDGQGPNMVRHEGILINPTPGRLVVTPDRCTDRAVRRAGEIAARALTDLPETPVTAAGVNLRYKFATIPSELIDMMASPLDDLLADVDQRIQSRSLRRSVHFRGGLLNLDVQDNSDGGAQLTCNFHLPAKGASARSLGEWLTGETIDVMIAFAKKLLEQVIKVRIDEVTDE